MMQVRKGFVLILAVALIGLMSVLVMSMVAKLIVFEKLSTVLVQREQAKQLAWSGIQIAIAEICETVPVDKKLSSNESTIKQIAFEIRKLITITNQWQQIKMTEPLDGIEGSCSFYIASEKGKLNPNVLVKLFKKNEKPAQPPQATPAAAPPPDPIFIINDAFTKYFSSKAANINMLKVMNQLTESRHAPFDDITELFEDDQFKKLHTMLFLRPGSESALFDLFSLQHESDKLQPWALSSSFALLFGLKKQKKITEDHFKKITETITQQQPAPKTWEAVLEACYGEKFKQIPQELYSLFSIQVEQDSFSVISYGTYRDVVVMLYAIVERKENEHTGQIYGSIKRLYWIYS